jgi:hypothetical protein
MMCPMKELPSFVKQLHHLGVSIAYLTGRDVATHGKRL